MSQPESKGAAQISAAVNSGETTALAVLDDGALARYGFRAGPLCFGFRIRGSSAARIGKRSGNRAA